MTSNQAPNTQTEWTNTSLEKKSNPLKSLLAGLALSIATAWTITSVKADVESSLNLDKNNTVSFISWGTAELYKEGGKFYIKNENSENWTDFPFLWIIIIDWKSYSVKPSETDDKSVILSEYKSEIWLDYSKYWKMAWNFQAWELEYLTNIEPIIQSKPEKIRDRIKKIYYTNWKNALEDIYDWDWKIESYYLDLFIEKTPNTVLSWKWLWWYYWVIYEKQQADSEKQQADSEKQQAKKDLETAKMFSWK